LGIEVAPRLLRKGSLPPASFSNLKIQLFVKRARDARKEEKAISVD